MLPGLFESWRIAPLAPGPCVSALGTAPPPKIKEIYVLQYVRTYVRTLKNVCLGRVVTSEGGPNRSIPAKRPRTLIKKKNRKYSKYENICLIYIFVIRDIP